MKKLFALFLVICMVFSLVACGGSKDSEKPADGDDKGVISTEVDEPAEVVEDDVDVDTPEPVAPTLSGDEAAVAALMDSAFATGFVEGFKESSEGMAEVELSAKGTEVIIAITYTTLSSSMFAGVDVDDLIAQMHDTGSLLETFQSAESAISEVTIEIYGNDGVMVGTGSRS